MSYSIGGCCHIFHLSDTAREVAIGGDVDQLSVDGKVGWSTELRRTWATQVLCRIVSERDGVACVSWSREFFSSMNDNEEVDAVGPEHGDGEGELLRTYAEFHDLVEAVE